MKRRTALRLTAAGFAGLTGLAGCLSADDRTPPGGTDTVTPTESPTPAPTTSPEPASEATATPTATSGTPRIADRSFRVTGRTCGRAESGAHVTFDTPRVVVEGTATGSNGCATARLGEATYDPGSDTLNVVVKVYQPDDARACTQCLTDIDYRLRVRFEGGTPGSVRVVHGDTVVEESSAG